MTMRVAGPLMLALSLSLWHIGCRSALLSDPLARADDQAGLYWLDNDRVLFRGYSREQLGAMKSGTFKRFERKLSRTLYIAHVQSGAVKQYAVVDADQLCFSHDAILYSKNGSKWHGTLGAEKEQQNFGPRAFESLSNTRCSYLPAFSGPPDAKDPARVFYLQARHGNVEIRPTGQLFLWRPAAKEGVHLSGITIADSQNLSNGEARYSEFKGAYLLYTPGVSGSVSNKGWWLFPDGKTQRVSIPEGPWNKFSRTNAFFIPIRDGLLVQMLRPTDSTYLYLLPSTPNGYAAPTGTYDKPVWRLDVSPNGCKVAIQTKDGSMPSGSALAIEVLDLCGTWKR